jgi:hypothetical protein
MSESRRDPGDFPCHPAAGSHGAVRARFEQACRQGLYPRIEDYLAGCPATDRANLFRELLAIELSWRRQAREQLTIEEYTRRFPEHTELIVSALTQATSPPPPLLAEVVAPDDEPRTRVMAGPPLSYPDLRDARQDTGNDVSVRRSGATRLWPMFRVMGTVLAGLVLFAAGWWLGSQRERPAPTTLASDLRAAPAKTAAILDFKEIHGARRSDLQAWVKALEGSDYLPVSLSVCAGDEDPHFNAIAIRNRNHLPFRITVLPRDRVDEHQRRVDRFTAMNKDLRARSGQVYLDFGRKMEILIWMPGAGSWEFWSGTLDFITSKVNLGRKTLRIRPVNLTCSGGPPAARTYACQLWPDEGLNWEVHYSLSSLELEALLDAQRARGWRPDVLSCFWDGKEVRFMTVLVENPNRASWSFRKDMLPEEYEQALVEENQRGMRPIAVVSYLLGAETRYTAVWLTTPQ